MERFEFIEGETKEGFYLIIDEVKVGEITFRWRKEDSISINHTLVEPKFRGLGYGKKLVDKVLQFAEENHLSVSASCWFADKVIQSQLQ